MSPTVQQNGGVGKFYSDNRGTVRVARTWIDENVPAEASLSPNDTAMDSDCV
jgi:hypothetical protein